MATRHFYCPNGGQEYSTDADPEYPIECGACGADMTTNSESYDDVLLMLEERGIAAAEEKIPAEAVIQTGYCDLCSQIGQIVISNKGGNSMCEEHSFDFDKHLRLHYGDVAKMRASFFEELKKYKAAPNQTEKVLQRISIYEQIIDCCDKLLNVQ